MAPGLHPTRMIFHVLSHGLWPVRSACRFCRHVPPQVVTPCIHCGTPLPRLRLGPLPFWLGIAAVLVLLLRVLGSAPAVGLASLR
ncbi:MAG TPA: hypothetical protein VGD77_15170 [Gemmatimonadaceae bacterium]